MFALVAAAAACRLPLPLPLPLPVNTNRLHDSNPPDPGTLHTLTTRAQDFYVNDPVALLGNTSTAAERALIIGGECTMWAECVDAVSACARCSIATGFPVCSRDVVTM